MRAGLGSARALLTTWAKAGPRMRRCGGRLGRGCDAGAVVDEGAFRGKSSGNGGDSPVRPLLLPPSCDPSFSGPSEAIPADLALGRARAEAEQIVPCRLLALLCMQVPTSPHRHVHHPPAARLKQPVAQQHSSFEPARRAAAAQEVARAVHLLRQTAAIRKLHNNVDAEEPVVGRLLAGVTS
jgi:hypothetical protein